LTRCSKSSRMSVKMWAEGLCFVESTAAY
jgi:hypothetical protein